MKQKCRAGAPQDYGEALSLRFEAVVVGLCGRFEERDVLAQELKELGSLTSGRTDCDPPA